MNREEIIHKPILVFDSGVGGISVLRELVTLMPQEKFLYFGDSKHAPYGIKTTKEVKALTLFAVARYVKRGIKGICIACNTATSAAVKDLRKKYPDIPLVGIEPALKPAAKSKEQPNVLVMATPITIREKKFQDLLKQYEEQANILQLPCPGLMEYIEHDQYETEEFEQFLWHLLKDYQNVRLDSAVLGCTHYSFVKKGIQKALGEHVTIFDGAYGTAKELKRRLDEKDLLLSTGTGEVKFECSDDNPQKLQYFKRMLEKE